MRKTLQVIGLIFGSLLVGVSPTWAVDGVVLIDQNKAMAGNVTPGDAPGFPVTISLPGSYRLAGNLVVPDENTTAIMINASDVSLDLNGFAILGPNVCPTDGHTLAQPCTKTGFGYGIDASGYYAGGLTIRNTRISNGTIDGVGANGILASYNARIENINVTNCGGDGIDVLRGVILNSLVQACGGNGISATGIIRDSRVTLNRAFGILTFGASVLSGNAIDTNGSIGLYLQFGPSRYFNNVIDNNNGGGASLQVYGGTQAGNNTCSGGLPCP